MAKASSEVYECSACGWQVSKWLGQCPNCKEWGSFVKTTVAPAAATATSLEASIAARARKGRRKASEPKTAETPSAPTARPTRRGTTPAGCTAITGISATAALAIPTGIGEARPSSRQRNCPRQPGATSR